MSLKKTWRNEEEIQKFADNQRTAYAQDITAAGEDGNAIDGVKDQIRDLIIQYTKSPENEQSDIKRKIVETYKENLYWQGNFFELIPLKLNERTD